MARASKFRARFWGVRGSIPTPGGDTTRYGGNTSCIEVLGGEERIIMDAGTGIRELGLQIVKEDKPGRIHLLISHTHWDHIHGFPFFMPIYDPRFEIRVYGPRALQTSLQDAIMFQMQYSYFPVRGIELQAQLDFQELDEEKFTIGDVEIETHSMNHPIRVLGYKFKKGRKVGVYTGDNEPYYDIFAQRLSKMDTGIHRREEFIRECNDRIVQFISGSDLLIADCQYTDKEYETKRGWGHSSLSAVLDLAQEAKVKQVALFHHEPTHNDKDMDAMHKEALKQAAGRNSKLKVITAKEGLEVPL